MPWLQETGVYKAKPYEWGYCDPPQDVTSQSESLQIKFKVLAKYDREKRNWVSVEMQDVSGRFCIIKRDGSPNDLQIESLRQAFGWDGKASTLESPDFMLPECTIDVREETYNGKVRYLAKFVARAGTIIGAPATGRSRMEAIQAKLEGKPVPQAPAQPPPPAATEEVPF